MKTDKASRVPAEAQPPDLLYEAAAEIINHVYHYPTTVDGLRKILSRHFGEAEHAPRSQEAEGFVVSGKAVRNLWQALADYDELRDHSPRQPQDQICSKCGCVMSRRSVNLVCELYCMSCGGTEAGAPGVAQKSE